MASYRNKRKKIQEELQTLNSSDDNLTFSPSKDSSNEQHIFLENSCIPEKLSEHNSVQNNTFNRKEIQFQAHQDLICVSNTFEKEIKIIKCNSQEIIKKKTWKMDYRF